MGRRHGRRPPGTAGRQRSRAAAPAQRAGTAPTAAGRRAGPAEADGRPLVSLVVIARDDVELVASLLRHHRPLYDEAVVVDTGSRDGTAAAAAAAGARVFEFAWSDDFAAARNAALAQARGRWILSLDADERFAVRDLARARAAAAAGDEGRCYLFPFRTYTPQRQHAEWQPVQGEYPEEERGQDGYFVAVNIRLYPNRPDLRYRNRVHESVEADARRLGLALQGLDIPVHHYGLARPPAVMARKSDLYGRLVRAKFDERPDDTGACLEMACRLIEEKDIEAARPLLESLAARPAADAHVLRGRLYLAHLHRRQGRLDEARRLLEPLVEAVPEWPQAWVELVRTLAGAACWDDLRPVLAAARRRHPHDPLLRLEECVALVGERRLADAAAAAEALAAAYPDWEAARGVAARLRAFRPAPAAASQAANRQSRPG